MVQKIKQLTRHLHYKAINLGAKKERHMHRKSIYDKTWFPLDKRVLVRVKRLILKKTATKW